MCRAKRLLLSIILITCMVLPLCSPALAADNSCTWGYYTITLPQNYICNDYNTIPLYAEAGNAAMMQINMIDLSSLGLPASTDVLGESEVIDALLESSYGEIGLNYSVYKAGTKNAAAYQIISTSVIQSGTELWMIVAGVVKKNMMLLCVISNKAQQDGLNAADELINNLIVHDELQEESFNYVDLNISQESTKKQVDFIWEENRVTVTFPSNYDIYNIGMGSNSPITEFLGYSAEEMESFAKSMQRTGILIYALDMNIPSEIRMTFEDQYGKIGTPAADGNFTKSDLKAYYDGMSTIQGAYSTKTLNGIDYYIFPDYENGYKIRFCIGTYEVSLLMKTLDNTYSEQQRQEAIDIISSVQIAKA